MDSAILVLGLGILGGTLGGALTAIAFVGRLYRRCTLLEWAVADLQDRASSFRGRDMAEKRWKKADALDSTVAQALQGAPAASRRYDNDPLGT
jgi:hypothetical protein